MHCTFHLIQLYMLATVSFRTLLSLLCYTVQLYMLLCLYSPFFLFNHPSLRCYFGDLIIEEHGNYSLPTQREFFPVFTLTHEYMVTLFPYFFVLQSFLYLLCSNTLVYFPSWNLLLSNKKKKQ